MLARFSVVVALAAVLAQAQSPVAGQAPSSIAVIRNATILTATKGTIRNGTIVVRDGRIAAVGANIDVPAGAEVYDASGKFVTPGLIDAHSHIAADSINEGGTTVSSMTGIEDVLDPTDGDIYRDLAGGVTTANVLHGSANPIGGKNAVIKLRWGATRAKDLLFQGALPGIKFALGENPKDMRQFGQQGPRRYPLARAGVEFVIRDAFTRARAYRAGWQDYERARKAPGGDAAVPPRRDLQLEPLVEVLEGKRLVHAHCYRSDEILMLIRLAEEMGFRIATVQHVLEGYKVAKEIAAHGAGASTFSDWWGYKIEANDAIPQNAALMTRRGVLVSINSDSAEHARRLNTEAAKSVRYGLSEDEALALVTINPAKQLRIDQRVGSIEPGKDADLTVWNQHPLSSYAIVERTYIDGKPYYDRSQEEKRLTDIRKEKQELIAAEKAREKSGERERRPSPTTTEGAETARGAQPAPPQPADAAQHRETPVDPSRGDAAPQGTTGRAIAEPAAIADTTKTPEPARAERTARMAAAPPSGRTTTAGPAPMPVPVPTMKPPAAPAGVLAIVNAKIYAVTRPPIEKGTVLVRDGRIADVGANVQVPSGATILDAKGGEVYPGWIDARSTIGLDEPGARGYDDAREMLDYSPQLRTVVSYHAASDAIPVARANGITTTAVTPSGGVLSGQIAVVNLDGWTWEESAVTPAAGIAFQFPALGGGRRAFFAAADPDRERTYEDLKKERDQKLEDLIRLLDQARAYGRAAAPDRHPDLVDLVLEGLVPVAEGRLPLFTRADREEEIREAIAFADRAKVKIVISGGLEAPLVAKLLKEKDIPVILGPVLQLPTRPDMSHAASYQAAGELAAAGVRFAFASGDATNARLLPYHAAQSVAWGLSRDAALKALTIDAAGILGVADRLGSLEPGKIANLFVANGDPLEVRTTVTHVIINGRQVPLMNKHQALYEKYAARP